MSECKCHKDPWWARQILWGVTTFFQIGMVLAVLISWERWHSIKYSLFTGFCGWWYVAFNGMYDSVWMK